jgi:hypothetical protein
MRESTHRIVANGWPEPPRIDPNRPEYGPTARTADGPESPYWLGDSGSSRVISQDALQAGGHRFDPGWLHLRSACKCEGFGSPWLSKRRPSRIEKRRWRDFTRPAAGWTTRSMPVSSMLRTGCHSIEHACSSSVLSAALPFDGSREQIRHPTFRDAIVWGQGLCALPNVPVGIP